MYVTNSNLNLVIESVELTINELSNDPKLVNTLSTVERTRLEKAKELFGNKKVRVMKLRDKPIVRYDAGNYVNEGGNAKPAYHLNSSCERLNAEWRSFPIPEIIKQRQKVEDYRRYVKGMNLNIPANRLSVCAQFGITDRDIGDEVVRENSGSNDFSSTLSKMSLKELDAKIDELYEKLNNFGSSSADHMTVYRLHYKEPYQIRSLLANRSENVKQLAQEFSYLKDLYIRLLMESYKKAANFDQSAIEDTILQELDFIPCRHCIN